MLKTVHIWGSYLFLLTFIIACALCALSMMRKQIQIERASAWSFVISFVILAIAYACGFTPEAALSTVPPEAVKLASRHHDLAKFALTGMMLVACSALTVLFKYRKQRFPNWFLPNLLFLSLMIASFSFISMTYIWKFENHPDRDKHYTPPAPTAPPITMGR